MPSLPCLTKCLQGNFSLTEMADSNPNLMNRSSLNFESVEIVQAGMSWDHFTAHTTTDFRYTGAGFFLKSDPSSSYHTATLREVIRFRHSQLRLDGLTTYSAQSANAVEGQLGIGTGLDNGISTIAPGLTPNQSIFSTGGSRLSTTGVAEYDWDFARHQTLNLNAAYGRLSFTGGGLIDSNQATVSAGYDYRLNRRNTVGAKYSYADYTYSISDLNTHNQKLEGLYSHRIGARLLIEVGGGPEFVQPTHTTPLLKSTVLASARASAEYKLRRNSFNAEFWRGTTTGGGILQNATADNFQAGASRIIDRNWSTSLSATYANNSVDITHFHTISGFYSLRRTLGLQEDIAITALYQRQTGTYAFACVVGSACAADLTRLVFGVAFNWNSRKEIPRY